MYFFPGISLLNINSNFNVKYCSKHFFFLNVCVTAAAERYKYVCLTYVITYESFLYNMKNILLKILSLMKPRA